MTPKRLPLALGLPGLLLAITAQADPTAGWTGCYAGANAGYGRAHIKGTDLANGQSIGSATADGGTLGAQAGCDWQAGAWVAGGQLALAGADLKGSHRFINGSSPADRVRYEVKGFASVTARAGYLVQPDTLAYARAGAAWARTDHDDSDPTVPYQGNRELTRSGWLAGAGIEHRLGSNLALFAEYSYADFGRRKTAIHYNDGTTFGYAFKQEMKLLSLGANYRF